MGSGRDVEGKLRKLAAKAKASPATVASTRPHARDTGELAPGGGSDSNRLSFGAGG